jgi:hypothetical protein
MKATTAKKGSTTGVSPTDQTGYGSTPQKNIGIREHIACQLKIIVALGPCS